MARWRFTNVTKSTTFWPTLLGVQINDQHPFQQATLAARIVDVDADQVFEGKDELVVEYAEDSVTYVKIFGGDISVAEWTDMGRSDPRVYQLDAQDYTARLADTIIDEKRNVTESVTDRVTWIMGHTPSRGITTSSVASIATSLDPYDYTGMSRQEALDQVAGECDAIYYVDFDLDLHFFVGTEVYPAPFDLVHPADPPDSYPYWDFRLPQDYTNYAERVLVKGATTSLWVGASGTEYQRAIDDSNLTTATQLTNAGNTALAKLSAPVRDGDLTMSQPGIRSGMQARIVHPSWSLDETFQVRSVSVDMLDPNDEDAPGNGGKAEFHIGFTDKLRRASGTRPGQNSATTSTTETLASLTRYQLYHEVGGHYGPDVVTGTLYYDFAATFGFAEVIDPTINSIVNRKPEHNIPWEYTPCGIGFGGFGGLVTREAWYRFQVDLTDATTDVKVTVAPFIVGGTGYTESPSGMLVGDNTVIVGIHTGSDPDGAELTTEGEYTEVGRVGDQGGEVLVPRSSLITAADGYCWIVLAPGFAIGTATLTCDGDPIPYGYGDAGDDSDSIVSVATQTFYTGSAAGVTYDPTASGLAATDVQAAIDALAAHGTVFPSSPSVGDRFWRTDQNVLYFWDGSFWLSVHTLDMALPKIGDRNEPETGSHVEYHAGPLWSQSILIEDFIIGFYVSGGTALSGSHKWVVDLLFDSGTGTITHQIVINSGASNVWRGASSGSNYALSGGTFSILVTNLTKTGTPGDLYINAKVMYRLIGT